ncbi:MAG: methyltransferase domain-containing protein [Pseudomonadota bacterium]
MKAYLEAARASAPFAAYKRRLAEALALKPGERMLDIGCGLGDDVRAAARAVAPSGTAVGVEHDAETLAALGRPDDWPSGVRFTAGDATALPFRDASFDVARLDRVLHMMDEPARALAEARRVLVPGGRLLVAEPLWTTLRLSGRLLDRSAVARRIERATADAPGVAAFDPVALARAAGCGIVETWPLTVAFRKPAEARALLHLDRTVFGLRLRKEIGAAAVAAWQTALEADAADGSFSAHLGGVVLRLTRDVAPQAAAS